MTRSRKKVPIVGIAAASEKQDKRWNNRRVRVHTRRELQVETEPDVFPETREVSDQRTMAKDGKVWVDAKEYPKVLGK